MYIDTHSHIYSAEYNGEIDDVISRASLAGVQKIMLPNVDSSTVKRMLDLSARYPQQCFPMMGIHPTSVNEDFQEELSVFDYWISKRQFYGIGEIGIDLYWDKNFLSEQETVFRHQLNAAKRLKLPVSIHVRESFDETIAIVEEEKDENLIGIFHAFSGTVEQANRLTGLGFKLGVSGVLTFKNAGLDKIFADLSLDDLVLETDAPWLSPVPLRGKRNESANLIYIAQKLAEVFNTSEQEIERITTHNAKNIFRNI